MWLSVDRKTEFTMMMIMMIIIIIIILFYPYHIFYTDC